MANKDDLLLQIRKLEDFVDSLAATSSNIEEKLHDVSCTLQKIRCWAKTLIGHVPEVLTKAVQDTTTAFLQLPDLTRESTNSTDPLKAILTSAINSYQRTLEITMSSVSPEIVPEVHHPMDATQLLTKCDRLRLEIMNSEEYIHTTRLDKKDKENLWETMSCLRVSVRKLELNITSIESCIHLGRTTADTFNDCMTFLELVHCLTGIPLEIDALKLGLRGFLLEIDTTRSLMQTLHSDTHVGPQQSRQNNGFPKDIRMDDKAVITVKDDSSNGTLGSADIQCCDDSKAVMKQSDYHPQDYQIDESVTKEGHAASYKRAHGSQNRPILLDSDSDIQSRHTNSSTSLSKQASATRQAVEPTSAGRNTLAGSNTHMVHDVLTMSEPGTECTTREIIETIHRIYGIRLDKKQVSRALHSLECVEGRRNGYTVERRSDGRTGFYKHNPTKCNFKTKPIRLLVHDLMLSESGTVDYIQTKFNKKHPKMALSKKKVRTYLKSIACCDSKLENFPTTFYHNQRKCNIATQLLYLHRNSCDGSRLVDCNHPGTCTPDSDSESEYAPSIDIDLEDGNSTSLKGKSACNSASKNQNGLSSLEKAYECDNCTSRYWHERDLRRHKKNLHTQFWSCMSIRDVEAVFIANSTHKNVICGYCGQKFDQLVDQNARIEHVTRTHGFYVCPGKRVFSSDAFQDHLRDVHNGTIGWWTGAFADSVRVEKVGSKRKLTYEHENFQDSSRKGAQKNQFRSDQQREGWTRDDSPVEMNVDNSAIGDNAAEHTDDQADGRQDVNWISRTEGKDRKISLYFH
ncbi:hypothetical protein K469DRAFT_70824 [Zopfia rhizophila CBS 207.26]|uniref:C2H2-type domain-containing protein n=1 Tax=Zopfia rhizophila CBS 207.26 TaxID=1314779 RepID=A0A6A6E9Z6_9PEZI|nr:hypothetical protein K469DRAFT_70824 [Zopfia rhizophila CBS 207.26]